MIKFIFFIVLVIISCDSFAQICSAQTEVLVICNKKRLFLCENGDIVREYNIAIGKGGTNKTLSGDHKTPIGIYPLHMPRHSNHFGIFIPIGYPTPTQVSLGCSGCDVGIHGPYNYLKWLGRLNCWINWTEGCIAVGKNSEIDEIADWVNNHDPVNIRILVDET